MSLSNSEFFTFNGVDIRQELESIGAVFIVNNTSGRGLMSQEHNTASTVAVDGERLLATTLPKREINVEYTLKTDDLLGIRKAEELLGQLLLTDDEKELAFDDQDGYYEAIHTNVSISRDDFFIQQGTLSFTCHKPFRYGEHRQFQGISIARNTAYVHTTVSNYLISPFIQLSLINSTSRLMFTINGESIIYEGDIPSGASVTIDSRKLQVRVDGKLKVLELDGKFPLLKGGANTIVCNTSAQLGLTYQDRYI